jgi:hypothetical protein
VQEVIETLDIKVLERVGARYVYSLSCKSLEEARLKAAEAIPALSASPKLFNISATSYGPSIKLEADDGELGFVAQLFTQEKKFEFNPPPDLSEITGLEKSEQKTYELVLDFDLATKKPIRVEAFDARAWLLGWNKILSKDADAFLNYLATAHE